MKMNRTVKVIDRHGFYDYVKLYYLVRLIKGGKVIGAPTIDLSLEEAEMLSSQGIAVVCDSNKKRVMFSCE